MRAINRCVAVVRAKQPFLDWANGLPDPMAGMTLASLNDDSHAYLLPEYAMVDDQVEILAEFYDEIFVQELAGWYTDERAFPKKRTLAMFQEWFDVEFHSMVLDVIDDEGSSTSRMSSRRRLGERLSRRRPRPEGTKPARSFVIRPDVLGSQHGARILAATVRLLLALLRASGFRLVDERLPQGATKASILRAVTGAQSALPLALILRILGMRPSRYHAWRRVAVVCGLDDRSPCPRTVPGQLTAGEIASSRTWFSLPSTGTCPCAL